MAGVPGETSLMVIEQESTGTTAESTDCEPQQRRREEPDSCKHPKHKRRTSGARSHASAPPSQRLVSPCCGRRSSYLGMREAPPAMRMKVCQSLQAPLRE